MYRHETGEENNDDSRFDCETRALLGKHPHFRPATFAIKLHDAEHYSWSDMFTGDPEAAARHKGIWQSVGIVAARAEIMEELEDDNPDSVPAIAYRVGRSGEAHVAALSAESFSFGRLPHPRAKDGYVHGFALGAEDLQFSIGRFTTDNEFVTPDPEDVISMGPVPIHLAGDPATGFDDLYFS
jgi:hypothetical protein